jgi:hypothetical protein
VPVRVSLRLVDDLDRDPDPALATDNGPPPSPLEGR